jgi:methylmalonyl-CoA mutase cobalamin-binding domain/chain
MPDISKLLQAVIDAVIDGDGDAARVACQDALLGSVDPRLVLDNGLVKGAGIVGERFESGEYYLPELMLAGRALQAAMEIVRPELEARHGSSGATRGKVVIATVKTDIHDIGKGIVASMLTASGFHVLDLGVDVAAPDIVSQAEEMQADVVALSSLLTTSMPYMRDVLNLLVARGLREKYTVLVGGASVSSEYAREIGADGYGENAVQAVQAAKSLVRAKPER